SSYAPFARATVRKVVPSSETTAPGRGLSLAASTTRPAKRMSSPNAEERGVLARTAATTGMRRKLVENRMGLTEVSGLECRGGADVTAGSIPSGRAGVGDLHTPGAGTVFPPGMASRRRRDDGRRDGGKKAAAAGMTPGRYGPASVTVGR